MGTRAIFFNPYEGIVFFQNTSVGCLQHLWLPVSVQLKATLLPPACSVHWQRGEYADLPLHVCEAQLSTATALLLRPETRLLRHLFLNTLQASIAGLAMLESLKKHLGAKQGGALPPQNYVL